VPKINGRTVIAPEFNYIQMQIDKDTTCLNYYKSIKEPNVSTLEKIKALEERITKYKGKLK